MHRNSSEKRLGGKGQTNFLSLVKHNKQHLQGGNSSKDCATAVTLTGAPPASKEGPPKGCSSSSSSNTRPCQAQGNVFEDKVEASSGSGPHGPHSARLAGAGHHSVCGRQPDGLADPWRLPVPLAVVGSPKDGDQAVRPPRQRTHHSLEGPRVPSASEIGEPCSVLCLGGWGTLDH